MSLNIIKNYVTKNSCYIKGTKITPTCIQLHTIGTAQGTAESLRSYWNQAGISACTHAIVDADTAGKVIQIMPYNYRSWADAGVGNNTAITFEIMESDHMKYSGGANFTITEGKEAKWKADIKRGYETAVEYVAYLCKEYGFDPTAKQKNGLYVVFSHYEGYQAGLSSGHVDPTHVWGKMGYTMDKFRKAVKECMQTGNVTVDTEATDTAKYYRVRKTWADSASQLGAYTVVENAVANCPSGYSVFDQNGQIIYSNTATGTSGMSEQEFVSFIGAKATADMKKHGVLASVTTAQAILESGYGQTDLAVNANNLFGMKCTLSGNTWTSVWDGTSKYTKYSPEVYNGVTQQVKSDFRKYATVALSVEDHSLYLLGAMNGSKKRYEGLAGQADPKTAITIIKNGGYATDPQYVTKIMNIIEKWNLTQYDDLTATDGNSETPQDTTVLYRVRKTWKNAESQLGAFKTLENAIALCNQYIGYKVFDQNGAKVHASTAKDSNATNDWVERLQKAIGATQDNIAGKETLSKCPTLRRGNRGNITKLMQERLVANGINVGTSVDGIFGDKTYAGVKKYQKVKSLTDDGIVGKNTWKKLLGLS